MHNEEIIAGTIRLLLSPRSSIDLIIFPLLLILLSLFTSPCLSGFELRDTCCIIPLLCDIENESLLVQHTMKIITTYAIFIILNVLCHFELDKRGSLLNPDYQLAFRDYLTIFQLQCNFLTIIPFSLL
jgi:hypothetical protein